MHQCPWRKNPKLGYFETEKSGRFSVQQETFRAVPVENLRFFGSVFPDSTGKYGAITPVPGKPGTHPCLFFTQLWDACHLP